MVRRYYLETLQRGVKQRGRRVPVASSIREIWLGVPSHLTRLFSILLIVPSAPAGAQTYTATNLRPPGSTVFFGSIMGLNNKGQVLGDACSSNCFGVNRFPAVWTREVITPLPIPSGYTYFGPAASEWQIGHAGVAIGTLQVTGTSTTHVVAGRMTLQRCAGWPIPVPVWARAALVPPIPQAFPLA